ncbi:uracil-DNA glycosylase [Bordetella sp. N]|uniref:uracil-DNA glycosylase n=1 Tax=Bordetella sp. N TaxID=1746199 RepID=UPI000709BF33|nr:uracil-DNA glycosylase [Bordetella sp. N]ALM81718.1 DNA polymerase [Bordetella sp. N]
MIEAGQAPAPLRVNALQRAWLRELGIEKVWARQEPEAADAGSAGRVGQGAPAAGAAAALAAARGSTPGAAQAADVAMGATAGAAANDAGVEENSAAAVDAGATAESSSADAGAARPSSSSGPAAEAVAAARKQAARSAGAQAKSGKNAPGATPVPMPDLNTLDIEGLRTQVTGCTACGLCEGRRQAVFGDGAQSARWMVVGEAPGEQEDRQGLPFVGRSGQLLDAMLASVGMTRQDDVFIANVIKCRPPGNRNPKPEEIAACSPYLMRQIALLKPERILVLGRFAAQTLLGSDAAVGNLRGRVHTLRTDDGREIPVVVSYHPAYLLRSPNEKARSWKDLQLAVAGV